MPFNGAGQYTPPAADYPVVGGTLIESTKFNDLVSDLSTALSLCITADGQQSVAANIPGSGFALTNWRLRALDGAVGTPGITFDNQQNAGFYRIGANDIGFAIAGALVAEFTSGAMAVAGTLTASSTFTAAAQTKRTGVTSPAQLTATTNDWAPANFATSSVIRFSTDARRTITGLAAGADGLVVTLHNIGTFPAVFSYQDAGSAAANRFAFGHTLGGGQSLEIIYDGTSSLWRAKNLPEPIGTVKDFATGTLPAGYLAIDQDVSRTIYASLFNEVGTTWGTGDGTTTFGLWMGAGAALIASGTGTQTEAVAAGSVSTVNDTFTVAANDAKWITGMAVVLTTTSTLPTGLALATTYYVIRASSTTIKFATSLANAQNGTAIDLTTTGTGTHTLTWTGTARTLGQRLGEEAHAMSSTEQLAHSHGLTDHQNWMGPGGAGGAGMAGTSDGVQQRTQTTGGNAAMNIMGPSAVVTRGVRYC